MPARLPIAILIGITLTLSMRQSANATDPRWIQRTSTWPTNRYRFKMAYDGARERSVLYGGIDLTLGVRLDDTWEWDGQSWQQRLVSGPGPRADHSMAFDSARGVTVMFGGHSTINMGDTWEWDGADWTLRASTGPSARSGAAIVFDSARGVMVLFGGTGDLDDTWEWDGASWDFVSTNGPSGRRYAGMAYDSVRGVSVLFGGRVGPSANSSFHQDTWEWDGNTWALRATGGPSPKAYQAMAYDPIRGVVVMQGGSNVADDNVWEWDGSVWTPKTESPRPGTHTHSAMVYDTSRSVLVLTHRTQGTWEYIGNLPDRLLDADRDGDVDLDDYEDFEGCLTGPGGGPLPVDCEIADPNSDGAVDLGDFARFVRCFSGPDIPSKPGCPQ